MANKHHDQMGAGFNGGKRWSPPKRTFGTPGMNMKTPDFPKGNPAQIDDLIHLSSLTYGRDRATVENTIRERYLSR